jgi:hypothetical protein
LLLVTASLSLCAANYEEKLTLECAKRYLKDKNVNEDLLSYVNPYVGSLTDCESAVKSKLTTITSNLRSKLNGNRLHRPFVECVMRDIEEEDDESYDLLVLRETTIEMISGWRFWSYWSKSSRVEELQASAQKIVDKSLLKCKGHREFGDLFTNIQEGIVSWDRSGEDEYCIRTYLVNKTLLNPQFYSFRYNPRNVQSDGLNCEPLTNAAIDKIYDEVKESKSISNCFLKVYRDNNYADYLLKAEVLSKLSLGKSDKSREKQDFINSLTDITYDTQKC